MANTNQTIDRSAAASRFNTARINAQNACFAIKDLVMRDQGFSLSKLTVDPEQVAKVGGYIPNGKKLADVIGSLEMTLTILKSLQDGVSK